MRRRAAARGPACPPGSGAPARVEHGRRHVDELHRVVVAPARAVRARELDDHRHVHERLVQHAAHVADRVVLAEHLAVVGGDDDERVLVAAARLQRRDQLAERGVHRRDLAVVVGVDELRAPPSVSSAGISWVKSPFRAMRSALGRSRDQTS